MSDIVSYVKSRVPLEWKTRAVYWLSRQSPDIYSHLRGKKKAIIALAADYANLGDVAISYAQARFLSACLPDYEVVDFPCASTYFQLKALKAVCTADDLITIVGGGNMGDLHASIEDARRFVVSHFPQNRIVSFPQTCDFSNTVRGRNELKRSRRCYEKHRLLHVFAREPVSLESMRIAFPTTPVDLVPDIVLSLPVEDRAIRREKVLACVRDDCESAMGSVARADLLKELAARVPDLEITDTVLSRCARLSVDERSTQLDQMLARFCTSRVVVTDRLHGMLFAVITNTPCVVLTSLNHKIRATYQAWLSSHPNIILLEAHETGLVLDALASLEKTSNPAQMDLNLNDAFEPLRRAVCGVCA